MNIHCGYDELVPICKLKLHPRNPNKHSTEQVERLAKILSYQGWRYPVNVSNLSGYVVSGHGRIEAAKVNGWESVPVKFQDFTDEDQEYAAVISDNSIASWAELDLAVINNELQNFDPTFDIDLLGIKDFVLDPAEKLVDEDEALEAREDDKRVQLGQLFILGNHRLLCGDSTELNHVNVLMNGETPDMVLTDPPYGMFLDTNYSGLKGGKQYKKVLGDADDFKPELITNIFKAFTNTKEILIFGADYFAEFLPKKNSGSWIVWDKRFEEGKLDYAIENVPTSEFELIWSKNKHHRKIARFLRSQGFYAPKEDRAPHPTLKPTKLLVWLIEQFANDSKSIADLYGGSGSTLIACEKTNRKCFMMELDPHYCAVILDRWAKYTGKDPIREDGTPWSTITHTLS